MQRACAHEHEEKAKVATKRAAEEERRFHKRQAELEGRAACREAELESHMTKLQSERAQVVSHSTTHPGLMQWCHMMPGEACIDHWMVTACQT